MNWIKTHGLLILVVIALPLMLSCSSDDGSEDSVKHKLIGIWKTSMSSSNWKVIQLKSDGSLQYSMWVKSNGEIWGYSKEGTDAHWSYNETEQTISMYSDNGYYSYTYKVNMSDDGNSWAGYTISSNGSTKTVSFIKIEGEVHIGTDY